MRVRACVCACVCVCTESLKCEQRQESVGPPVGVWLVPPHVEAPDVEANGQADVRQGDADGGAELLHQHSHHSGLERWRMNVESCEPKNDAAFLLERRRWRRRTGRR